MQSQEQRPQIIEIFSRYYLKIKASLISITSKLLYFKTPSSYEVFHPFDHEKLHSINECFQLQVDEENLLYGDIIRFNSEYEKSYKLPRLYFFREIINKERIVQISNILSDKNAIDILVTSSNEGNIEHRMKILCIYSLLQFSPRNISKMNLFELDKVTKVITLITDLRAISLNDRFSKYPLQSTIIFMGITMSHITTNTSRRKSKLLGEN